MLLFVGLSFTMFYFVPIKSVNKKKFKSLVAVILVLLHNDPAKLRDHFERMPDSNPTPLPQ